MLRVCPTNNDQAPVGDDFLSFTTKLFLYSFDARGQFREPAVPREKLFEFLQRTSRGSP